MSDPKDANQELAPAPTTVVGSLEPNLAFDQALVQQDPKETPEIQGLMKLPYELRTIIYDYMIGPRLVSIKYRQYRRYCTPDAVPAILHLSAEAREHALKRYSQMSFRQPGVPNFNAYIDFTQDVFDICCGAACFLERVERDYLNRIRFLLLPDSASGSWDSHDSNRYVRYVAELKSLRAIMMIGLDNKESSLADRWIYHAKVDDWKSPSVLNMEKELRYQGMDEDVLKDLLIFDHVYVLDGKRRSSAFWIKLQLPGAE